MCSKPIPSKKLYIKWCRFRFLDRFIDWTEEFFSDKTYAYIMDRNKSIDMEFNLISVVSALKYFRTSDRK